MRGEPGEILKDKGDQINPTGAAVSVSAKRQNPEGKAKGIRPKGLTYEELGRKNGSKMMVVEELEDCRREMRRSVSNRNGGSHMMLDNKTEQK